MPHPAVYCLIQGRIADTRQRASRLSLLYGLSRVAGVLLGALLLLGLADYLIHFTDPGIRALSSLALIGALAWAAWRYLYPQLGRPLGDVEVAQKIERRFPALGDRLSSSVEFLRQAEDDQQAGSAALRRAVIVETTAAVERLDLSDALERGPTRRALAAAGGVLLIALAVVAGDPFSARLALARLLLPLGGDAWPRQHELEFVAAPVRVAVGQPFEVELRDRKGPPPAEVRIHYLYDNDGRPTEEVELMHPLDGLLVARKENVARPFKYRAEGGDDQSLDWIALEVVEPPRVESLAATLSPPPYTGWPEERVENNIQALRGTRVAFRGTVTKPIRSATLHAPADADFACRVTGDGYGFELAADAAEPFVVDQAGPYWFELLDAEGLGGGQESRWEIRAVADQPPSINVERPGANLFVTPMAVVPLRVVAKDDLALRSVMLHFSRSDAGETADSAWELYAGPTRVEPAAAGLAAGLPGDSRVIEQEWDLAPLDLKPGSQLAFYATADDYLPQTGRGTPRRLIIITPRELEDRLAQRQTLILSELRRALKMQQDSRAQTAALEVQVRELGRLGKQDIDHVQGAELSQRQVARTLTSPSEGIPAHVKDLLADLASNRVDNGDTTRRMEELLAEIGRLESDHLGPIERELTSAIKGAQVDLADSAEPGRDQAEHPNRAPSPAVGEALTQAGQHQDAVIHSLESLLDGLSEWDSYRRFGREVAQIERDQEELQRNTKQLGAKILGQDVKDLDAQQHADLKKLAQRQVELGRRFDKVLQQMDDVRGRLEESDPLPAATLADALHQARRQGTSGQMRSVGDQVERNQLGQAGQGQEQARKDLSEILDILANRREHELSRLVKKLKQAEQQLAQARQQHQGLQKKRRDAAQAAAEPAGNPPDEARQRELERLTHEERKLQAEIERLARQLERLQAERASRTAAAGAAKVGRQSAAGERGDAAAAEQQADLAEQDLENAQRQLAERRKEVEADLARAQLARLKDALKSLHERQEQLLAETVRLEDLHAAQRERSRAQIASLRGVAREQEALAAETRSQAEKLSAAEVFNLALSHAARDMQRALALLDRQQTGAPVQQAEQDALARLAALLAAVQSSSAQAVKKSGGAGAGGDPKPGGASDAIRLLAELKLLKLMQEDLNRRYQQVSTAADPAERSARLNDLSEEQGRLAEVALKLSKPAESNPEDDPDKLPDLRNTGRPKSLEEDLLPGVGDAP